MSLPAADRRSAAWRRAAAATLLAACVLVMWTASSDALAAGAPEWVITSSSRPTNLPPGSSNGGFVVMATNVGEAATAGTVTVADVLPAGLTATAIVGSDSYRGSEEVGGRLRIPCSLATLTCEFSQPVGPGDTLTIMITVSVPGTPAATTVTNHATVSGGGAATAGTAAPTTQPTRLEAAKAPFGPVGFYAALAGAQAGGHSNLTTAFTMNEAIPDLATGALRDASVELPAGLVGNVTATGRCGADEVAHFECPRDDAVGVATSEVESFGGALLPGFQFVSLIYNVTPYPGEPAAFEFETGVFPVRLDTALKRDADGQYRVRVTAHSVVESGSVLSVLTTFWGVPAEHNGAGPYEASLPGKREEEAKIQFGGPSGAPRTAFLSTPGVCGGDPLTAGLAPPTMTLSTDPWQQPGRTEESELPDLTDPAWLSLSSTLPQPEGCARLVFTPSVTVAPDTLQAGAPAGYTVDLHVPQPPGAGALATPDLQRAVVTLPPGAIVSPSAANGLQACSDNAASPAGDQFRLGSQQLSSCPPQSAIGTVEVRTPLLAEPLEGHLYLGAPECSPCSPGDASSGRMIKLLLEAHIAGVESPDASQATVKVEGSASVDQTTGQLTTTFDEDPQLPFEDLKIVLDGGPRAPLANPATCGTPLQATASLTSYSDPQPIATASEPFELSGCPGSQFSPTVLAGTTSNEAGAYAPFAVTVSRPDQQQTLSTIALVAPPGLLGELASVPLCGQAQADAGTCPAASQIGHTIVGAGPGSDPLYVPEPGLPQAPVYLAGPYKGAPFSLSVVVPAVAGPFDLGTVVVRAAIRVDRQTGQVEIQSDPLPSVLDGVPLQVRTVDVVVDRPAFMFNPTSCNPLAVTTTITSAPGAAVTASSRFQAANCASLKFRPSLSAFTSGNTTRADGASLDVRVSAAREGPHAASAAPGEANIARVDVQLPAQLPSRLSTLQRACTEAQFAANPAGCPPESDVGTAVAHTPVLPVALEGPAFLVSHGGAQFPDLVIVLQGDGVVIDLVGHTQITKGVTYSHFDTVPDAPIVDFELRLPERRYSALGAFGDFCARRTTVAAVQHYRTRARGRLVVRTRTVRREVVAPLPMPTTLVAQNGAVVRQTTEIAVVGCAPARARRATHLSRTTTHRRSG